MTWIEQDKVSRQRWVPKLIFNVLNLPTSSSQIDSSTIDDNVEFVHSQYSCILSSQVSIQLYSVVISVNSVFVSNKIIINSDNLRVKCLSYSKISAILFVLYFLFWHFFIWSWKTCQLKFRFPCYIWHLWRCV